MAMMTLEDLCREISVSFATGKNWLKLEKIKPQFVQNQVVYFSEEYVCNLKNDIQSGVSAALKSRRNKKYVSGIGMYHSYVSKDNKNIGAVEQLLFLVGKNCVTVNEKVLALFIADCAISMLSQRMHRQQLGILQFLNGEQSFGAVDRLLRDLIGDYNSARNFVEEHDELFHQKYVYEENEDLLGLIYISGKNLTNRKAAGSYYTPTEVVRKLINQLFCSEKSGKSGESVIDPCCGTGNFLLHLPEIFEIENIYGNDIDEISIKVARINMVLRNPGSSVEAIYEHICVKDNLFLRGRDDVRYDYVIGNPPWGYSYSEKEREYLNEYFQTATRNRIESFDLFTERSLSMLKKNGVLMFILPEAILNVKTHRDMRKIIAESNSVQYIEFLGDIFDGVQCPSIMIQIQNTKKAMSCVGMKICRGQVSYVIQKERFIDWESFDFDMTDQEYETLRSIYESVEMTSLKGQSKFALGIITGDNKKMISDRKKEMNEVILKGSDLRRYQIIENNRFIDFCPKEFQQVAPTWCYRAPEKLLYRFISNQLIFAYDDRQRLSLNSCNILIPQIEGLDIKYILAVLNSSVAQFVFYKRFHSIKVLRSHIEQIPIPVVNLDTQNGIIQYVDHLLRLGNEETQVRKNNQNLWNQIYRELDMQIMKLYGLSTTDMCIISSALASDEISF